MLTLQEFIKSFQGIRKRTMKYVQAVPEEKVHWAVREGKFSLGELIVHLGSTEKMFCHAATTGVWLYEGHDHSVGNLGEAVSYLRECHEWAMNQLSSMTESDLTKLVRDPEGRDIPAWRILSSMSEHEIHHRGQLSAYLQFIAVDPPQIFDRKVEQFERG